MDLDGSLLGRGFVLRVSILAEKGRSLVERILVCKVVVR